MTEINLMMEYSKFVFQFLILKKIYNLNHIERYIGNEILNNENDKDVLLTLKKWKDMFEEFNIEYEDYISNNDVVRQKLEMLFQTHYDLYQKLEQNSQKDYILDNYGSTISPFTSRFSQGRQGYGDVKFEGSTIRKSGCGICAFASGISCALTLEYNQNIIINPINILDNLNNLSKKHYYRTSNGIAWDTNSSIISKDLTEIFTDLSIIELKASTPTFTETQLKIIAENYPVVISLNGRDILFV